MEEVKFWGILMFAYFFNSQVSPAGDQAEQALADTDYD